MRVPRQRFDDLYYQIRNDAVEGTCTVLVFVPPLVGALTACRTFLVSLHKPQLLTKQTAEHYVHRHRIARAATERARRVVKNECGHLTKGLRYTAFGRVRAQSLLRQDFVQYKLVPVFSYADLKRHNATLVEGNAELCCGSVEEDTRATPKKKGKGVRGSCGVSQLRSIVMIDCGGNIDLATVFTPSPSVTIYVVDSHRPYNLENMFLSQSVFVVDENEMDEQLQQLEALYSRDVPGNNRESDEEEEDDETSASDESDKENQVVEAAGKRRRRAYSQLPRQRRKYLRQLQRHPLVSGYTGGSSYGTSAAELMHELATQLTKDTQDSLWLAIVGLTDQFINERISKRVYSSRVHTLQTEVNRYMADDADHDSLASMSSDVVIRHVRDEYRFMLHRHWSVYEAMFHSSYVATRLGIWREKGRRRLKNFMTKLGMPLAEAQERYPAMDVELKEQLLAKLKEFAPEFGLSEVLYQSFVKQVGFRAVMSAADVVYAMSALLEAPMPTLPPSAGGGSAGDGASISGRESSTDVVPPVEPNAVRSTSERDDVWTANLYRAYDMLDSTGVDRLLSAMELAIEFQKAIVRQGTSLIERKQITTTRAFRFAILNSGPDLAYFVQPLALTRLTLFLMEAIRESGKTSTAFVAAALNTQTDTYQVVGVVNTGHTTDVRQNNFSVAFERAATEARARCRHVGFDRTIMEVKRADLMKFLETLQTVATRP